MFSLLADKLAASPSLLFVEPSVLVESTIFFLAILEHFTWIMAQWFVSLDLQWDS
jgi:predicted metal-dependent hydrolase